MTQPTDVASALDFARHLGLDRLDSQILLLHAVDRPGHDRAWLVSHDGDVLTEAQMEVFQMLCARRSHGEPVAYLVGYKEFHGIELAIDPRVLIPRPDTETLVEWALEHLSGSQEQRIVDLGTGSGAIAIALKSCRPDLYVMAIDTSADALAVATLNARRLGLDIDFRHGDWLVDCASTFDLIVSNPPYIADSDPHLAALQHEPLGALTSGRDGLDDIRRIVAQAPGRLAVGGWLLIEHGFDQAEKVRALMKEARFLDVQSRRDLAGIERCTGGRRAAPSTDRLQAR